MAYFFVLLFTIAFLCMVYYNIKSFIGCVKGLIENIKNPHEMQEVSRNVWIGLVIMNLIFLIGEFLFMLLCVFLAFYLFDVWDMRETIARP